MSYQEDAQDEMWAAATPAATAPMTYREALTRLRECGYTIEAAPVKFQRRGFKFYCPDAGQMLSPAGLIEFAANEIDLRSDR